LVVLFLAFAIACFYLLRSSHYPDEHLKINDGDKMSNTITIVSILKVGRGYNIVQDENGNSFRLSGGTRAWRNNNPGNLKYSEFSLKYGAMGHDDTMHSIFPTVAAGNNAKYQLLFGDDKDYKDMTLEKAISIYAPAYDNNNPDAYVRYLCRGATYNKDTILRNMTEVERKFLLERMGRMEGYKEGKITKL